MDDHPTPDGVCRVMRLGGWLYEGQMSGGFPEGWGREIHFCGFSYIGYFANEGLYHGYGFDLKDDGTINAEAEFEDGFPKAVE